MKFTTKLKKIDFNLVGYKEFLHEFLVGETKESAKSWLRTVLVIIPTWSRASRATFEALANEVGFNVTYGPQRSREDRLLLGLRTGKGGLKITKFRSYHFFYETNLQYLEYNETTSATPGSPPQPFGQLINPTPYKFQEAGRSDFLSRSAQIKLPSPIRFIKGTTI